MRTLSKILACLLLVLTSFGCDKNISSGFGEEITIPFDRTASLYDNGYELTITFTALLEESRCPPAKVCFWEGRALVEIEVDNFETFELVYSPSDDYGDEARKVSYRGYTIELLSVAPKTDDGFGIEDKYSIIIEVNK